jgi:hypothetical protein
MEYKYARDDHYEDFASGRVLYHMGGEATFPVRLTLELYERCLQYSEKKKDIILYDCCCGGAYMLTVLGLIKGESIAELYGSDISDRSLQLASDNLSLLTREGLNRRRSELQELYRQYGKESHKEALQSIDRLEGFVKDKIKTAVFFRNALEAVDLPFVPDIILTDVPYGNMAEWSEGKDRSSRMMDALAHNCGKETILCVCMDKKQKILTDRYQRLEKQVIGKRRFEIYRMK